MKQQIAQFNYPSSSSSKIYKVILYDDNSYSCNCPSWIFKRGDVRNCKHCEEQRNKVQYVNLPNHQETTINISKLNNQHLAVKENTAKS